MLTLHFVHALPNAWLPVADKRLLIDGISAERLAQYCKGAAIVSHVRYDDHAARISAELGIELPASMENAPSPFNCQDTLVVASLSPGSLEIKYLIAWDATVVLKEAGVA